MWSKLCSVFHGEKEKEREQVVVKETPSREEIMNVINTFKFYASAPYFSVDVGRFEDLKKSLSWLIEKGVFHVENGRVKARFNLSCEDCTCFSKADYEWKLPHGEKQLYRNAPQCSKKKELLPWVRDWRYVVFCKDFTPRILEEVLKDVRS